MEFIWCSKVNSALAIIKLFHGCVTTRLARALSLKNIFNFRTIHLEYFYFSTLFYNYIFFLLTHVEYLLLPWKLKIDKNSNRGIEIGWLFLLLYFILSMTSGNDAVEEGKNLQLQLALTPLHCNNNLLDSQIVRQAMFLFLYRQFNNKVSCCKSELSSSSTEFKRELGPWLTVIAEGITFFINFYLHFYYSLQSY